MMRRFFPSTIRQAGGVVFGLLLDDFPTNAWAAHSVRLLSSVYVGNCVQVKRISDNALLDIGFVDGLLDTASMLTFAGSGTLRYERFYDQTGNGNDLVRLSALGSLAVESGVLVEEGGIPAAKNPQGTNIRYSLTHTGQLNNTAPKSVFIAIRWDEGSKSFFLGTRGTSGSGWMFRVRAAANLMENFFTGGTLFSSNVFVKNLDNFSFSLTHTDEVNGAKLRLNGEIIGQGRPTGGTNRATYEWNNDNGVFGINWMFEHIIYDADKNSEAEDIHDNINNYYSIPTL